MPSSSMTAVLVTVELLEAILIQLDMPTLLVSAQALYRCLFLGVSQEEAFQNLVGLPFTAEYEVSMSKGYLSKFMGKGPSWRRMLLTQPPPPRFGIIWRRELNDLSCDIYGILEDDPEASNESDGKSDAPKTCNGCRMGQLYDFWASYIGRREFGYTLSFNVLWHNPGKDIPPSRPPVYKELMQNTTVVIDFKWNLRRRGPYSLQDNIFEAEAKEKNTLAELARLGTLCYTGNSPSGGLGPNH
ncbi:hypothetical protein GGR58DRAFT_506500 [Xylaria digitata]|nr:hypothetical protein GGR58DRAFT_506500 [Xylaria digitata]